MPEIIIIGAGPSGLCTAKTFLQHNPHSSLILLESRATLGGVWAKEQLFPTLKTNNLRGGIAFTDLTLDDSYGVSEGEHVTGEAMHKYLCDYAEKFGVMDKIRFESRVVEVKRRGGKGQGWKALVHEKAEKEPVWMECEKLIVATGVLSAPHMPSFAGQSSFNAPIVHSSDLGTFSTTTLGNPAIQTIAVLGGGKSAYDAVYLACKTGHKVEWIIRKSGRGPAWVGTPHASIGPFKPWRERLITRRIVSFMSPWVGGDFSGFEWLRWLLHFTMIGNWICQLFWANIHRTTADDCGYRKDERIRVLEPEHNPLWYGTHAGVLSFDTDFFDLIRNNQVHIHREDIAQLSLNTIHLTNGQAIHVEALIAATGFSSQPTITFSPASLHSDLGLPTTSLTKEQRTFWAHLDAEADAIIGKDFPQLLSSPPNLPGSNAPAEKPQYRGINADVSYSPWRLYRAIAPPGLAEQGDRSIVFLGMFSNVLNITRLEIQCLWALAYMTGKLKSPAESGKVFRETAIFQRYTQHRAPYGHGKFYPDLVLDQLPYWDVLLNDLGVETKRKGGGFREIFEPYTQKDYTGLVDEWLLRQKQFAV